MGMSIKEIIDGLQFTIDMFLFNPSTGEIQPKHLLNEDSRLTVDACKGAIEIMRKYQELEQEPTTKNDLGVDCVSRKAVDSLVWKYLRKETDDNIAFYEHFLDLPSVTPQEPKWIPVSERLPENSGNYLITYCLQDKTETQEAVYVEDEDKWFDTTDIEITLAVKAWMPLPQPYSEVEE